MSQSSFSKSASIDSTNQGQTSIYDMLKNTNSNETGTCNNGNAIATATSSEDCTPRPTSIHPVRSASFNSINNNPFAVKKDSNNIKTQPNSPIDSIISWSVSTYKCTKQLMYEKLGKSSKTVDYELEAEIEQLRETQQKYLIILQHSRALTSHFYHLIKTQQALGDTFSDLAQKSPELQEEFLYNSETQKNLTRNGETLLRALNFFTSSIHTLCTKTIEDTLQTVRQYELARIKYDAYRTELETKQVPEAQEQLKEHKIIFEKLKKDVAIKLKFLDENRIKVMHKQLLLFHNAISAYFSGNQAALETTLKQFNIKMKIPSATFPSWIE